MYSVKRKAVWLTAVLCTSCFPAQEEDDIVSGESSTLKVTTRAATGEAVDTPISLYLYDTSGSLVASQTLSSTAESASLEIPAGTYHLTALAGASAYIAPASYDDYTASLSMPAAGYAAEPFLMGGADLTLSGGNVQLNVVLSYQVAAVNVTLQGVPQSVTAVSVSLSPQYAAIDMARAFTGSSTATVPCTLSDTGWTTETFYVFPSADITPTFTFAFTTADGVQQYAYTAAQTFTSAVRYHLEGTYSGQETWQIAGNVTMGDWLRDETISFDLGDNTPSAATSSSTDTPSATTTSLPAACSVWNGHIVALVLNSTATSEDILLLSTTDASDVYAPKAVGHETDLATLTTAYQEGTLTDWRIPTAEEARLLRTAYAGSDNLLPLNTLIENVNGNNLYNITELDSDKNNARYLCEDGTKTFNFLTGSMVSNAGATKKYRARWVKTVHLSLQ